MVGRVLSVSTRIPRARACASANTVSARPRPLLAALQRARFSGPSPARREIQQRLARSPLQVARQLAAVYGHDLNEVVYLPALALLVRGEAEANLIDRVLGRWGFRDPVRAAAGIRALATESFFLLSRARTERALAALLPELLPRLAAAPDPLQALDNLGRIVSSVGGRATFFELLATQPAQ